MSGDGEDRPAKRARIVELSDEFVKLQEQLEQQHKDLEKINDDASDQVLKVEQEFNRKRKPVYAARAGLLKKIPNFWRQTLLNHPLLRDMCTPDDKELLGHCSEILVEEADDIKSGFTVTFVFAKNPYFKNERLEKRYKYAEDGSLEVTGDVPSWNEGKLPFPDELMQDLKAARKAKKEGKYKEYRLFRWFVDMEVLPSGAHDELADIIKEDIWPNPAKYYAGEVEDEDMEDLSGEGEGFEDEDDDEGEEGFEVVDEGEAFEGEPLEGDEGEEEDA